MKKLMIFAASVMLAVATEAAAVGWTLATGSGATYANDAYQFFVIGQNGADSIATITALLDAGTATDAYAFGSGTIGSTGTGMVGTSSSGKSLDAGNYTAFFVLFDSATPKAGESKYVVVSGTSTLSKTIAATTANVTFASGSAASTLSNASNWKSYGAVPEPTSGLLMLLGMAGLALRRKRA